MAVRTGIGPALACLFAVAPAARAQSYVIPLPNFTVTGSGVPNSPNLTTVTSLSTAPAMTNILGFSVQANWAAGSPPAGDPNATFSQEFQASITPAGVATSPLGYLAGLPDSNPYTFGFGPNSARTINGLTGLLPGSSAGTLSATFTTASLNGTTANLTNVSVTVFTNPASANGTTAGGPTFARPIVDGSGVSTVANNVRYAVTPFTVSQSGTYMLANVTHAGFDGMLFLYQNSFNPSAPLTNYVVGGDDDSPGLPQNTPSAFVANLNAGQNYFLVTTGLQNGDSGTFTVFGAGPGTLTINPVPEPATLLGVTAAGLVGAGAVRRRFPRAPAA